MRRLMSLRSLVWCPAIRRAHRNAHGCARRQACGRPTPRMRASCSGSAARRCRIS